MGERYQRRSLHLPGSTSVPPHEPTSDGLILIIQLPNLPFVFHVLNHLFIM